MIERRIHEGTETDKQKLLATFNRSSIMRSTPSKAAWILVTMES